VGDQNHLQASRRFQNHSYKWCAHHQPEHPGGRTPGCLTLLFGKAAALLVTSPPRNFTSTAELGRHTGAYTVRCLQVAGLVHLYFTLSVSAAKICRTKTCRTIHGPPTSATFSVTASTQPVLPTDSTGPCTAVSIPLSHSSTSTVLQCLSTEA
jgi:hypothetical protein